MHKSSRTISFSSALNEALHEEMQRDSKVFTYGGDIAKEGGRRRVTAGLLDSFGGQRVIDTPMNEELFVGIAIGAAQAGMRPIAEFVYANFFHIAAIDIFLAGLWRFRSAGKVMLPLVLRATIAGRKTMSTDLFGDPSGAYLSAPGIKIIVPSSPYNAKGLLKSAIRDNNPVLFLEHEDLYGEKGHVPTEEYIVPFGQARIVIPGIRATLITYGYLAHLIEKQLKEYCKENEIEVIDLLSIKPLDEETILSSAQKTKRVLIVEEGWTMGGVGAEVLSLIHEQSPEVRVRRLGAKNMPIPSGELVDSVLPSVDNVRAMLDQLLEINLQSM